MSLDFQRVQQISNTTFYAVNCSNRLLFSVTICIKNRHFGSKFLIGALQFTE